MNRLKNFFTVFLPEVVAEMRKVTFPSRQEVVGTTGVVLVTSVIFAVYLWGVDVVILKVYQWLMDMAGKMTGTVLG
jgi:preprotein translocase subunit SecE